MRSGRRLPSNVAWRTDYKMDATLAAKMKLQKTTRVLAVTSGKGGVGKTNIVGALALYFAGLGERVMILDAAFGLSNIDVLFGLNPQYNIEDVLSGERMLSEVVIEGPRHVRILPASWGSEWLTHLTEDQKIKLLNELDNLEEEVDLLLVDTGAGIASNVMFFCEASQEIIVVVTPEPTSITDASALIKVMALNYGERRFRILVNMVSNPSEGMETFRRLSAAADRFLNVSLDYLGSLSSDSMVPRSVRQQRSFFERFPGTAASKDIVTVARALEDGPVPVAKGGVQFFFRRIFGGVTT